MAHDQLGSGEYTLTLRNQLWLPFRLDFMLTNSSNGRSVFGLLFFAYPWRVIVKVAPNGLAFWESVVQAFKTYFPGAAVGKNGADKDGIGPL